MHYRMCTFLSVALAIPLTAQTIPPAGHRFRSAVAYVYVSGGSGTSANFIQGFYAAHDGSLRAIPNSSLSTTASGPLTLALNGAWLFGAAGSDIDSFSIASSGALQQAADYTIPSGSGTPVALFLDHTGATLYAGLFQPDAGDDYQSYRVDQSTGQLNFVNQIGSNTSNRLWFTANNQFAYTTASGNLASNIEGWQRNSDGSLSFLGAFTNSFPAAPSGEAFANPSGLTPADPTNHLAVALQPVTPGEPPAPAGPYQLASYTVDGSGNITTTNTYAKMPTVQVGQPGAESMSPDGKYLAVAGFQNPGFSSSGMQVFRFNGANPVTPFTGALTSDPISEIFWDNEDHLYAIGLSDNELFVFNVSRAGVVQAPGSPHTITGAYSLIVLPKTPTS